MSADSVPGYVRLLERGALARRAQAAHAHLEACDLCARRCGANRLEGHLGACQTRALPVIASYGAHFGEEAPLVGYGGSGTIFFAHCNLQCLFCQNYDISRLGHGGEVSLADLAAMMLELQGQGCHNINLVSPSHVVPQVLAAVALAAQSGLRLPIVYNSGGYDSPAAMRLLEGVVDIYMPDAKYADSGVAARLSGIAQYPAVNRAMIREAHRQVGSLALDDRGIARRGLLVRHLVLPAGLAGTAEVAAFLAREVSVHTYVNIMDQYRPQYQAAQDPGLRRRPTREEHQEALRVARDAGLYRLDGLWQPPRTDHRGTA